VVPHPSGKGKSLDLEPDEVEAIREAADQLIAGVPLARVVRWLNEHGPKPRRAAEWSRTALRQVLLGGSVLGQIVSNGKVLRDDRGYPLQPFPPVFTASEAAAVAVALERTPDDRKGVRHPARLLSGLLTCHACGAKLQISRRTDGSVTYRCPTRSEGGVCDAPVSVSAEPVEQYVAGVFLDDHGHGMEVERRVIVDGPDLGAVEEALSAALADLATAATPEAFARLQALQAEREALSAAPRSSRVEETFTGRSLAEVWAETDAAGRRDILADAFTALVLKPGRRGRHGFDPARLEVR
jgi:site-specific DNA recombinase